MSSTTRILPCEAQVSRLIELAIRGLDPMFDPKEGLFCHRLKRTPEGMIREGISERYTIMTLLGLLRTQAAGLHAPFDIRVMVDQLLGDTEWVDNIGDLGLLLWLCAFTAAEDLERFYRKFELDRIFEQFPDGRRRPTMELSWLLTGLAHAACTDVKPPSGLTRLANEAYQLLIENQGGHGIFGHLGRRSSLAGMVRGRVGSFADQVYPIYSMAHFGRVYRVKEAGERAVRCAEAICNLQGPMGQWWWHYDSETGRVVEQYPVYSVHQHAMGPMALFALQDTFDADFSPNIYKGLDWIKGANELHHNLEDPATGIVWRCIRPSATSSYTSRIRTLLGREQNLGAMEVLFECRPYELGWLLYAFAPVGPTTMRL
jgi:hypothetical protein